MKVYLSLIFAFFLITTTNASNNDCKEIKVYNSIYPNSDCDNPNGIIAIYASGENRPFKYEWKNNKGEIIESKYNTFLTGLKGGYYSVKVTSVNKPNCAVEKYFLVTGRIFDESKNNFGCTMEMEPPISDVKIKKKSDGSFDLLIKGYGGNDVAYKVNNNNSSLDRASAWIIVPKPSKEGDPDYPDYTLVNMGKGSFTDGNVYEFANSVIPEQTYMNGYTDGLISKVFRCNDLAPSNLYSTKLEASISKDDFILSPQPAIDLLTVRSKRPNFDITSFEVLNLNGQLIKKPVPKSTENSQLNVSDLETGIYLLKINSDKESIYRKIIIK